MRLETVQITDAVPDELRPQQLTARVPPLPVGREDAVPQKGLPLLVEDLALAKVAKLRGQDGLDVLRVGSEDGTAAHGAQLRGVASRAAASASAAAAAGVGTAPVEEVGPLLKVLMVDGGLDDAVDNVDGPGELCGHAGCAGSDGLEACIFLPSLEVGNDGLGDDEEGEDSSKG